MQCSNQQQQEFACCQMVQTLLAAAVLCYEIAAVARPALNLRVEPCVMGMKHVRRGQARVSIDMLSHALHVVVPEQGQQ